MSENSSLIRDIILSITGITGSVVAVVGLGSWKRQLSRKSDRELAKEVLIGVYSLRNAVSHVRSPFMFSSEMTPSEENLKKAVNDDHKEMMRVDFAYQNRFKEISDVRAKLDEKIVESEILWGKEIRENYNHLIQVVGELFTTINIYLDDIRTHRDSRMTKTEIMNRDRILYGIGGSEDEYWNRLLSSVKSIEGLVKIKLKL